MGLRISWSSQGVVATYVLSQGVIFLVKNPKTSAADTSTSSISSNCQPVQLGISRFVNFDISTAVTPALDISILGEYGDYGILYLLLMFSSVCQFN